LHRSFHRYHPNLPLAAVPWPWLNGREWADDLVVRCGGEPRRSDLAGWDEYYDPDTGVRDTSALGNWRSIDVFIF
jgi:hypothetical protein